MTGYRIPGQGACTYEEWLRWYYAEMPGYVDILVEQGVVNMARQTKAQKAEKLIDHRIERAYYKTCSGVQIDIMDIGKVFDEGRKALAMSNSEADLERAIVEFVATIRKN